MKKIVLTVLLALLCSSAWAQHFTVWYGVSSTNHQYWNNKEHMLRAANFGLDFTGTLYRNWKWTVGVGYNQKGQNMFQKMNYAQVEGNISYVFLNRSSFKVSALAGMYGAFAKDNVYPIPFGTRAAQGFPYDFEYKANLYGWQAGVKAEYHHFSLKLGYERSMNGLVEGGGAPRIKQLFARIGYSF